MAVGLTHMPELHSIAGISLGTTAAGIRKANRRDLVVIECVPGTVAAGVFTQNRFCAAPVHIARAHLATRPPRALLINTGFANAGTGEPGMQDARACCAALAKELDCADEEVLPFSTGVIGERLPVARVVAGLPACLADRRESGWAEAAHGIMTTDTVAKGASRRFPVGDTAITVTGIAKGAGMIRPNMATMLAFIATDANVAQPVLEQILLSAVNASFNRITVDGDTSTNDACLLLASGRVDAPKIDRADGEAYEALANAVREVCLELAQAIIRDAEGATKFMTIQVEQGESEQDCLAIAYAIAHSPLVKTAFFASDPNWGRILAAVGRAPVRRIDLQAVSIFLDDVCIVRAGARAPDYDEAKGQAVMKKAEITVRVVLGTGQSTATVWTSDLSHDYVRINAEYRT